MIAELWPHQKYSIEQTVAAIAAGEQRILLTAPTGAGKTRTAAELTKWGVEHSRKVLLLTNRKMVREQTSSVLDSWGITHGIRAAGTIPELEKDVQVSSIQTELSRVYKTVEWDLHDAGLVIIDEPHAQKGEAMARLMNDYEARGAAMIGTTATPIELAEYFTHLIVAATNKDCRNCGAHVPCETFAPDEPDLTKLGNKKIGEDLSAAEQRKVIRASVIFGRVLDHWRKLNPAELPTILFAPGVEESLFFAQQLSANGVRSAHVDGNRIWLDGEFQSSNQETREELREGSRNGSIKVICNRFVMREGVDFPWLGHCIMACIFGSLQSYLQAGGRLLRSYPGLESVTLQDHGGNYWRHGSLNADREWSLELTDHIAVGLRLEGLRNKSTPEPMTCPKCFAVRLSGNSCYRCGYIAAGKSRRVIEIDGTLREVTGDILKPRRIKETPNQERTWEQEYYHRARKSKNHMTFNQAYALHFREKYFYPPKDLPLMPHEPADWFLPVCDVPRERLIQPSRRAPVETSAPHYDPQPTLFE